MQRRVDHGLAGLARCAELGKRGEGVLVGKVDRGVVATATAAASATAGATLTTRGTSAASTGTASAGTLHGGLVESLLDLKQLLALLLGTGLGLLGLRRSKVVGLFLLVLGQLGPGRVVAGNLARGLGLDVELLACLRGKVLVKSHGLVLLLLGDLLGLSGGSGSSSASSVGALGLGVGLSLLLGVELLFAVLTTPALGDSLLRIDAVGLRVTVEGTASGGTTASATATAATALAVALAAGVLLLAALNDVGSALSTRSAVAGSTTALVTGTGDVALGLGGSRGGSGLGRSSLGGGDVLTVVCCSATLHKS